MATDESTRERILGLVVSAGPITAPNLAARLGVTSAGIRRHLALLSEAGHIAEHDIPGHIDRGRGRPPRAFVATPEGQRAFSSAYAAVASDALDFLRRAGSLEDFIAEQAAGLERALATIMETTADPEERIDILATALSDRGYAASVRPLPGGHGVQLCQGHCPVQSIAEAAPEWCDAETQVLSHLVGHPVQRLSTLATGAHVCTTNIPLRIAGTEALR